MGLPSIQGTSWRARPRAHFSWIRDGLPLAVILAVAFGALEWWAQHFWFFYDDWNFLLRERLGDETSVGGFFHLLFLPHNEHISVVPRLWFWAADALFGLSSYTPYVTASIVVHLATAVAGWVLLRQAGVDRFVSMLALVIMVFFGAGAENIFWAFQVGFMGGLMFGLYALVATNTAAGRRHRDIVGGALLIAAVLSSGTGIPMLIAVALALFLRSGIRRALVVAAPAVIVLLGARTFGGAGGAGLGSTRAAIDFAAEQLVYTVGAIFEWRTAGMLCFVAVAVIYLLTRYRQVGHEWVLGVLASAAMFALLTGISRSSGLASPETMRYLWFQGMLLIPVLAFLVNGSARARWIGRCGMLVIALVALNFNLQQMGNWTTSRPAGIAPNKALLLSFVANPAKLATMPGDEQPDPVTSPQVTAKLFLEAIGRGDFNR